MVRDASLAPPAPCARAETGRLAQQALALIEERDCRGRLVAFCASSTQVLAGLKRRAGMAGERPRETAALASAMMIR